MPIRPEHGDLRLFASFARLVLIVVLRDLLAVLLDQHLLVKSTVSDSFRDRLNRSGISEDEMLTLVSGAV